MRRMSSVEREELAQMIFGLSLVLFVLILIVCGVWLYKTSEACNWKYDKLSNWAEIPEAKTLIQEAYADGKVTNSEYGEIEVFIEERKKRLKREKTISEFEQSIEELETAIGVDAEEEPQPKPELKPEKEPEVFGKFKG
jgi:uncharacterized membrane protein